MRRGGRGERKRETLRKRARVIKRKRQDEREREREKGRERESLGAAQGPRRLPAAARRALECRHVFIAAVAKNRQPPLPQQRGRYRAGPGGSPKLP